MSLFLFSPLSPLFYFTAFLLFIIIIVIKIHIIVIETNKSHDYNNPVVFYNLKDDGFELAKKKGRRDVYNKWNDIKNKLLEDIDAPYYRNPKNIDEIKNVFVKIQENDEWLIQAFSKVEFDKLSVSDFEKTVKEFVIFNTKKDLNLLDKDLNEIDLLEILQENNASANDLMEDEHNEV